MIDINAARDTVKRLVAGTELATWHITVDFHEVPCAPGETETSAQVTFDSAVKRAIIWIDPRVPRESEVLTLEEILAHELAHCILGENSDDELQATRVGLLLIAKMRQVARSVAIEPVT